MRPVYIITFVLGILIPLGWETAANILASDDEPTLGKSKNSSAAGSYGSSRRGSSRGRNISPLEVAEKALARFDQLEDPKPWDRRQIQRLMFTLEEEHIPEVIAMLANMEHPERFRDIVRALYARWAELDPQSACEAARVAEHFGTEPLRGAMVTWLTIDESSALEWIGREKPPHPGLLHEWVRNYDPKKFAENAKAIDALRALWPEAGDSLMRTLAERWVMSDWEAASAWLMNDTDEARRNSNLGRIARLRGEFHGLDALSIADGINSDSVLKQTRDKIFYWWAFESPQLAIQDMADTGIPTGWANHEVSLFGNGLVGKHPEQLESALKLCQSELQTTYMCIGVLSNQVLKKPTAIMAAAEQLPDSALNSGKGQWALKRYYKELATQAPDAATALYNDLSPAKQSLLANLRPN